jgi:hypothetical protein
VDNGLVEPTPSIELIRSLDESVLHVYDVLVHGDIAVALVDRDLDAAMINHPTPRTGSWGVEDEIIILARIDGEWQVSGGGNMGAWYWTSDATPRNFGVAVAWVAAPDGEAVEVDNHGFTETVTSTGGYVLSVLFDVPEPDDVFPPPRATDEAEPANVMRSDLIRTPNRTRHTSGRS